MINHFHMPIEWQSHKKVLPSGYKPIEERHFNMNPRIKNWAHEFVNRIHRTRKPVGYEEFKIIDGQNIHFSVQPNYHEPEGIHFPWGWHKTVHVAVPETFSPGGEIMSNPKVKTAAYVSAPIVGFLLGGPIGAVISSAAALAVHHFTDK